MPLAYAKPVGSNLGPAQSAGAETPAVVTLYSKTVSLSKQGEQGRGGLVGDGQGLNTQLLTGLQ